MENPSKKGRAFVPTASVYKHYWRGIRPYRWPFVVDMLALAATAIVNVFTPLYYKEFFDVLTGAGVKAEAVPALTRIIVVILALNLAGWLFYRIASFVHNYFQTHVMARLRQNAFDHMVDHSYGFYTNNFTGSLVQRVNRFARAFERLTDRLVWNIIPLAVNIVGMSIVLWFVNPIITAVIAVWVAAFMTFNFIFSRWKVKFNVRSAEADSRTTGALSDDITNHTTIQLFSGGDFERAEFKRITDDQANIANFAWNVSAIADAVQGVLIIAVEFLLYYFATRYWSAGLVTVGMFVLIQAYFIDLIGKLWDFSRIIRDVYEGFADAKEMVEILELPHEVKDAPGATEIAVASGRIDFEKAGFSYNETREVLKDIDLSIKGGEKVALIGPSGAGKSTFVRLVLHLYELTSGAIKIDGQDIRHVTQESLRRAIAFVPQDPILFHRTLKENIRYGRRDATDEEVMEAARLAHCDEFVNGLPDKYDTFVGERGIKLSGGERQRVAIARAILKNAPILILDEATSSLDSESEHLIQDALATLMKGKTVIVIAHRLSTIRKMDRIIALDGGSIVEQGTHESLLDQDGSLYKKLWNLQAGGFIAAK